MTAKILAYASALLVGFILGYITKDLLTVEKKIEVNVKRQKIKGEGNTIDSDFDIEVNEKKEKRRSNRKRFINLKKKKS